MGTNKDRKPRKRRVRLWVALAAVFALLCAGLVAGRSIADDYETAINVFLDAPTTEHRRGDDDGVDTAYFRSDYETEDELAAASSEVAERLEAEGAVLLFNEGDALPLAVGSNVSLVSHSSVDPVYGGTGSGQIDASTAPTFLSALTDAGLNVNDTLWDYYSSEDVQSSYSRIIPENIIGASSAEPTSAYAANEVPWSEVETAAGDSFASFGDAAIFVLARSGGEGADLPDGTTPTDMAETAAMRAWILSNSPDGDYLALSPEEQENLAGLKALKDAGTISKIIVIINSSNALDCSFLNPEVGGVDYGIDAALWIGDPGQMGLNAVGKILVGAVNPSGSLVDTFVYDNASAPAMVNYYPASWTNAQEAGFGTSNLNYTLYAEGIYVGYRYYETRYEDYVLGIGNAGDYSYTATVAFPFGHSDSYTDFSFSDFTMSDEGDTLTVSVTVTNAGTVAGKKAVQVYGQQPYTDYDREHGVEKSAVQLVGYAKTKLLEPGESQSVTITVDKASLTSYDADGARTYILDAGDYYLTVATGSHEALNNILAAKGHTPESTGGRMDAAGDAALVGSFNNPELDATTYSISATGQKITNVLDGGDPNRADATPGSVTYLSRADWTGTWPERPSWTAPDEVISALADSAYTEPVTEGTMPTQASGGDLTLAQMIGRDYNDPAWEDLLDQLTFDDMNQLITLGGHTTLGLVSVSKPVTKDENGPQGLTAALFGGVTGMAFTSEDVMAATFNDELIYEVGALIGEDCLHAGYSGLYGPGLNMHRVPYGGRNFEYFSEDPFISGSICAAECRGITAKGVYVYLKHYALNEIETGRNGQSIWLNEQTAREIYLKPFELTVVGNDGEGIGVMNAFVRIGCTWTGASAGMQTTILRDEWGAMGINITDYSGYNSYMDSTDGVLAGTDLWDSTVSMIHTVKLAQFSNDPTIVAAMRRASHRILYTVANSNAMNGWGPNDRLVVITPWWKNALLGINIAFGVLALGSALMAYRAVRRNEPAVPKKPR